MRRSEKERLDLCERGELGHVPEVVAVEVRPPFGREQVERRDAKTFQIGHFPAILADGDGIASEILLTRAQALQERCDRNATSDRGCGGGDGGFQGGASRGCNRRALCTDEALRFGAPGQEYGIETNPVRRETLPEIDAGEGAREPGGDPMATR